MDAAKLAKSDTQATRREYLFPLPRCLFRGRLNDERDLPAAWLVANVLLVTVPWAACLHLTRCSHLAGAAYMATNYALFLQRFMLTLHVTEHRKLWKSDRGALDLLVPYLLCPLFGVPPGLYRPHHVVMHHVEDNHGQWDISSTEPYQRDSFLQFLGYWCRFFVGAWLELPLYAARRKRSALSLSTLASEVLYWLLGAWLWRRNTVATLWTLVLPFLLSSFLLSFGNWSQHVFIEPSRPDSPYTSAYECLNCPDNQRTYNDGYHIMHHLNSRWHWSELPQRFISQLQQHDDNDALVFHSLGFFDVGLAVFTGHLAYLAKHIVPCGPKQSARSTQQWVDVLRHRLSPVSRVGACAKST
ncbi:fatty acid desaturase-domain-containing protein [Haematococcus lacustris]